MRRQLLYEAQSVADNIIAFANKVYDDIQQKLPTLSEDDEFLCLYYPFYGQNLRVMAVIERFNGDQWRAESCYINWRAFHLPTKGSFSAERMFVVIHVAIINGKLVRGDQVSDLVHELEHAYQFCLRKNKNPNISTNNSPLYSYDPKAPSRDYAWETKTIERLLYFLSSMEQDAFLQELYYQRTNNLKIINGVDYTDMWQIIKNCKKGLEILENSINDPNMSSVFDQYRQLGYSPQKLLCYCQKQYDRLLRKVRKICGRIKSEQMAQNESLVHRITENIMRKLRRT